MYVSFSVSMKYHCHLNISLLVSYWDTYTKCREANPWACPSILNHLNTREFEFKTLGSALEVEPLNYYALEGKFLENFKNIVETFSRYQRYFMNFFLLFIFYFSKLETINLYIIELHKNIQKQGWVILLKSKMW